MVDIRCSSDLASNPGAGSIITEEGEILTFPQGEAEYAIYRPADAKGIDLLFQGFNEEQLTEAQAILDTLEVPEFDFTGTKKAVYTEKQSQLSEISQAMHNNPAYYKRIKEQYENQKCPRHTTNQDTIPLGALLSFMRKSLVEPPDRPINRNEAIQARAVVANNSEAPYEIFTTTLGFGVLGNLDATQFNTRFEDQVIRETERQRLRKCNEYFATGVVPEGELLQLKIDVDQMSSDGSVQQEEQLRRNSNGQRVSSPIGYRSMHDSIASVLQFYTYNQSVVANHNNRFKNQILALSTTDVQDFPVRFNRDVNASDFEIVAYNLSTPSFVNDSSTVT